MFVSSNLMNNVEMILKRCFTYHLYLQAIFCQFFKCLLKKNFLVKNIEISGDKDAIDIPIEPSDFEETISKY